MRIAMFSTKPYDRRSFEAANAAGHDLVFLEPRLTADTAMLAHGAAAVCPFVNDDLSAPVLEALAAGGTGLVALRCAGFNNVDLKAAAGSASPSRASRPIRRMRWPSSPSACCCRWCAASTAPTSGRGTAISRSTGCWASTCMAARRRHRHRQDRRAGRADPGGRLRLPGAGAGPVPRPGAGRRSACVYTDIARPSPPRPTSSPCTAR